MAPDAASPPTQGSVPGAARAVMAGTCVRIIRVSRVDETGPVHAQHFFHLLDCLVDDATRPARLKLVLQFNEGSIGTIEATCQNLRNVKERDRISREQVGRIGDMKLRGL